MNKQIITADHLNATHLGKRITINGKHGTVMSGTLKKNPRRLLHHAQFGVLLPLQRKRNIGVQ